MEKHTRGLKTTREFYRNNDFVPFELITIADGMYVMRNLLTGEDVLFHEEAFQANFTSITQGEVFECINNDNDDAHADMMDMLGIGYICPFCGGKLHWESDFMASEVHGLYNAYVEVEDEHQLDDIIKNENDFMNSRILGVTNNIEEENDKVNNTGYYEFSILREDKDVDGMTVSTYYVIDDAVIGIYRCSNCGKSYEIQDCLPSEQKDYPFFDID